MLEWRNWQTCTLEGRMLKDVGVRVPFRAQKQCESREQERSLEYCFCSLATVALAKVAHSPSHSHCDFFWLHSININTKEIKK